MHLPGPLRAAVGLAATAADELKSLPDRAVELPMVAVSSALQLSLRAQQRYTALTTRGEQVLSREQPGSEPPSWATFDEPATPAELRRAALRQLDTLIDGSDDEVVAATRHPSAAGMFEELFGVADPAVGSEPSVDRADTPTDDATVTPISRAARTAPTKRTAAKKGPAKKSAVRKTAAKKAATTGKQVSKPRHRPPSKFDDADG